MQLIPSNRWYFAHIFHIQLFRGRLSEKVHATIPKGTADGFESTVLKRNFSSNGTRGHGRMLAIVKGKQQKVGLTSSVSGTLYLANPYYLSGLSHTHFFLTTFLKIAEW